MSDYLQFLSWQPAWARMLLSKLRNEKQTGSDAMPVSSTVLKAWHSAPGVLALQVIAWHTALSKPQLKALIGSRTAGTNPAPVVRQQPGYHYEGKKLE